GPTIPIMMGARAHELQQRDGRIIPVEAHGVRFMSMGFLAAGNQPLIWRGPMAHRAVQQSLLEVEWGDLDYLIVDMPPGTGDVHLTLVQTVSLTGAVIVSTPQDVGLIISLKTFKMFEQTHVHPLGLIENMSFHVCTHCGEREDIFGHGIVAEESLRLKVPFLGEIPLDVNIRKHADQGLPIILADPDTPAAMAYLAIIDRLAGQIAVKNHNAKPLTILEEAEPAPRSFSV
ncbi:MAG TPA: Mrp/NBP35 family ATP-binding protein, partial [Nitrospiria bacterium]